MRVVSSIFLIFAVSQPLVASPNDPGKAAIDFLEKVRLRKLDLAPGGDTAVSAQIIDQKKQKIARRLDRMAQDLGTGTLKIGAIKTDENFAAVLVRKISDVDPGDFRVFPVAMVKRGNSWAPAPVPASFENIDKTYSIQLKERLKTLENWMLSEQISDLERIRMDFSEQVLRRIQTKLTADTLRQLNVTEVGELLLAAFQQRNVPLLLGLLGGLSDPLPDDWPLRLNVVERALKQGSPTPHAWKMLIAPEVARVIVQNHEEKDEGLISIACLDPTGRTKNKIPRCELINFRLIRNSDRVWQVNPTEDILSGSSTPPDEDEETDAESASEILDEFAEKWLMAHPLVPQPNPELAQKMLTKAFADPSPTQLLKVAKIRNKPEPSSQGLAEAIKLWWSIRNPLVSRNAISLSSHAEGDEAVGLFQFLSARDPDRFDPKFVYFERTSDGWLWKPNPRPELLKKFDDWTRKETQRWQDQWHSTALASNTLLDLLDPLGAPSAADSRRIVEQWLAANQSGDFTSSVACTARLNDAKSGSIALQNLGYEIAGIHRQSLAPTITKIYQGETWSAVGVKDTQDGKTTYPFYPIIQTRSGARIVAEIDLIVSGNRNRNFLNKEVFGRLSRTASPALADELRSLFAKHQADVESMPQKP